jgi:hypothetical protein
MDISKNAAKKAFAGRANEIHFNIVAVAVATTKFS